MNLIALVVIAGLVTALLIKSRRAAPALVSGVVTLVLLFAAFPTLGPAVTSSTAEFAHQIGAATDRAANVPQESE
jgi:hypothetical protein